MHTVKQELIYCARNDYPLDTVHLGYVALNKNGLKGRLIGIIDAVSQIGSTIISLPGSLCIAGVILVEGIGKRFFGMKSPHSPPTLILNGLLTPLVGIPVSLVLKTITVAGNLLGVICPEIGRQTRLYYLVFCAAIATYLNFYNGNSGFAMAEKKTRYDYSYVPLAVEIGYVAAQLSIKNNLFEGFREVKNFHSVVNEFFKKELKETAKNPNEILQLEFTASWKRLKPVMAANS